MLGTGSEAIRSTSGSTSWRRHGRSQTTPSGERNITYWYVVIGKFFFDTEAGSLTLIMRETETKRRCRLGRRVSLAFRLHDRPPYATRRKQKCPSIIILRQLQEEAKSR